MKSYGRILFPLIKPLITTTIHYSLLSLVSAALLAGSLGAAPLVVEVKPTPGGPRLFVDGRVRNPRFYYGSDPCLFNLSNSDGRVLNVPLLPPEDTKKGCVAFRGYPEIEPITFADSALVDLTAGTTNLLQKPGEVIQARDHVFTDLELAKGHRYWLSVRHHASRYRTYFDVETTYTDGEGCVKKLPDYYGDSLGDTVRLAADAGVDFVIFSTYTSWGCNDWWTRPGDTNGFAKIDATCRRLIAANPRALLVPRVMADAPYWMIADDPSMRMTFDRGFTLSMSSVSSRPYRAAACEAIGRLARHLRTAFPRNFAGLQISGQNSAEWFYMLSQSWDLSGYDVPTRDAFRLWLKARGDPGWATAEVPTAEARHRREKDARLVEFARFRQREMASFLLELGEAAKRATDGETLVLFFYGYSWELGGVQAGAAETGHFDFDWLMRHAHGKIDAFSAPVSYGWRNLLGSPVMMSPAESVIRNGYLWFNEIDHRTHREEMWEHTQIFRPYTDPAITQAMLMRDSAVAILRGYGDWWMDLFGRGWFRDEATWDVRRKLNRLEEVLADRKTPYRPQIASVVHEPSLLQDGWGTERWKVLDRSGFARCGADYGQYLLADVLEKPPESVKLFYLVACDRLDGATRVKLEALKKARPDAVFVENPTPDDLTAEAIAARAKAAGVRLFVAPEKANVCSAERFVAIQSLVDEVLTINVGREGDVIDFLSGERFGKGPFVEIPFKAGQNRVLEMSR